MVLLLFGKVVMVFLKCLFWIPSRVVMVPVRVPEGVAVARGWRWLRIPCVFSFGFLGFGFFHHFFFAYQLVFFFFMRCVLMFLGKGYIKIIRPLDPNALVGVFKLIPRLLQFHGFHR